MPGKNNKNIFSSGAFWQVRMCGFGWVGMWKKEGEGRWEKGREEGGGVGAGCSVFWRGDGEGAFHEAAEGFGGFRGALFHFLEHVGHPGLEEVACGVHGEVDDDDGGEDAGGGGGSCLYRDGSGAGVPQGDGAVFQSPGGECCHQQGEGEDVHPDAEEEDEEAAVQGASEGQGDGLSVWEEVDAHEAFARGGSPFAQEEGFQQEHGEPEEWGAGQEGGIVCRSGESDES